jgi:hypothetical protein
MALVIVSSLNRLQSSGPASQRHSANQSSAPDRPAGFTDLRRNGPDQRTPDPIQSQGRSAGRAENHQHRRGQLSRKHTLELSSCWACRAVARPRTLPLRCAPCQSWSLDVVVACLSDLSLAQGRSC